MRGSRALSGQTIYRQGPRTAQYKGREAGEVQQVSFVAWRPELRAGSRHCHELDRAEPVGQMHGKYGYQQNYSHRDANNRDESAKGYCQASE